jgi:ribonucleotide reductase alpha subunit
MGAGNTLGEHSWITRYARNKPDGTRERFHEGLARVINGVYSIQKDYALQSRLPWDEATAHRSAEEAYERAFQFKWLPPGRSLWMMGSEMVNGRHDGSPLYNCFRGDTEIITQEGVRSLKDLAGGTAVILSDNGQWIESPVRSFGVQSLMQVNLVRQGIRKTIYATAKHRWIGYTSSRKQKVADYHTDALRPGTRLKEVFGQGVKNVRPSVFGIAHGFTFGDGRESQGRRNSNSVSLFGNKDAALMPYFEPGHSRETNAANVPGVEYTDLPNFFKRKPSLLENKSYLYGWLAGYFAADGSVSSDSQVTLSSTNKSNLDFVRELCYLIGIGTYSIRSNARISNLTGDESVLYSVTFMGHTLSEDFFVIPAHRDNFLRHPRSSHSYWRVESVEPSDIVEEVFCATVPDKACFTLADNILTGNCSFVSTENLADDPTGPFTQLMNESMLGIGVGFDTRGAGKVTLHEPSGVYPHAIADSREGWCDAVGCLLRAYFTGSRLPNFDYSRIRAAGTPIKTFGGVAAGPAPLMKGIKQITALLRNRAGDAVTSRDIVDIQNICGKIVVSGNVRRSAEIALGDAGDEEFLNLKDWKVNPERMGADGWGWLSNNSVLASSGQDYGYLAERIKANGEPGLYWLDVAQRYGRLADSEDNKEYRTKGLNPCGEIPLESYEKCNLVETFPTRATDFQDYMRTLKFAFLFSKSVTLLPVMWPEANEVMARNRRIGVSMSGVAQFAEAQGWHELKRWQDAGYKEVRRWDRVYSEWLGVRESIRVTTVKPSGTVSLLAGVTPGVHWPRERGYYVRTVRGLKGSPFVKVMQDAGYPVEPAIGDPDLTVVITMPVEGPDIRPEREVSVWEKASLAASAQHFWADNSVSCTITFRADEADQIPAVLRAFDGKFKSISFLPDGDKVYPQSPYQRIPRDEWEKLRAQIKPLDWDRLYSSGSLPEAEGESFCSSDFCELPVK